MIDYSEYLQEEVFRMLPYANSCKKINSSMISHAV